MTTIEFDSVSKRYRLGTGNRTLRDALHSLGQRLFVGRASKDGHGHLWALKSVSFSVEQGEVVGIIGPNGAGKSTILKLLSSVTHPTEGRIHTVGRVSALIEVGAGFHRELTGRENIYLNGCILGMERKEVARKFNKIVQFSELDKFIDTPIKRYSSGMYVRLGFSVAAHVDPDILLVDEVLAVGDANFQRKCLDKIREVRAGGTTILFVTHNLSNLRKLCDRTIVVCDGKIAFDGDTGTALIEYGKVLRIVNDRVEERQDYCQPGRPDSDMASSPVMISGVKLLDSSDREVNVTGSGDKFKVRIEYHARKTIRDPVFAVGIWSSDGVMCHAMNTKESGFKIPSIDGHGWVEVTYAALALLPGIYELTVAIQESDAFVPFDVHYRAYPLEVTGAREGRGIASLNMSWRMG